MDTQAIKHSIQHSGRYNRRGFESPTKRAKALGVSYQSELIASIRLWLEAEIILTSKLTLVLVPIL